ncbi:MAG: tRNA (adenosine(37)-N6)-threonylcarbamoyltransferase complex ATPase subunit type 1 TsaE [Fibrobacterales bacterium]
MNEFLKKQPFISRSEEETELWAREFSHYLKPGDSVALHGNLGAGKTVVSRGVSRGLGYQGTVHSPTYSLVHEYQNDPLIYHIDLYRLPEGADFEEIGVEYYSFGKGVTLIEWPERLDDLNVGITHEVVIEYQGEGTRSISVTATKVRSNSK